MSTRILIGDCRDVLKTLPDASVHCCVSSPPYWALRSYLPAGHPDKHREIGSEPTVHDWVRTLVDVMREVRRVLRDDGTCFLNLGDSYAGSGRGGNSDASTIHTPQPDHAKRTARKVSDAQRLSAVTTTGPRGAVGGLKPKDLIGQPWRLAFALQEDGWWLRQEIIWNKRNPMPESVRDRFTKAHEHVFLLTKSERYYWDFQAIQEPASETTHTRRAGTGVGFGHGYDDLAKPRYKTPDGWDTRKGDGGHGTFHKAGREKGHVPGNKTHSGAEAYEAGDEHHRTKGGLVKYAERARERASAGERMGREPGWRDRTPSGLATGTDRQHEELDGRFSEKRKLAEAGSGTKNNGSFDEAMAVMPPTRNPRDVRTVDEDEYSQFLRWKAEQSVAPDVITLASQPFKGAHFATYPPALIEPFILAGCPPRGTVLDPFGGSGTTGLVADRNGRHAILIDLDARNLPMATSRIVSDGPLFAEVATS